MSQITQSAARNPPPDSKALRRMEWIAGILGLSLVIVSMTLSFIHANCKQVSDAITEQNTAATKIVLSLEYYEYFSKHHDNAATDSTTLVMPAPGLLDDLIDLSRRNVSIMSTADRLNLIYSIKQIYAPKTIFQEIAKLKPTDGQPILSTDGQIIPYFNHFAISAEKSTVRDVLNQGHYQIQLYQAIRDHAQQLSESWLKITAQIMAYMMPVFYAVLGAFLFTFRSWCQEGRIPYWPDRISRLLMAGIVGVAIGAMSELFPKEISLSPLALAFIIGYSIEVFISRLDAWIHNYLKTDEGGPTRPQQAD
jgi:hypothetical protein